MASKLDAFGSSQDINLDTDGNEQYGDFYGGMECFHAVNANDELFLTANLPYQDRLLWKMQTARRTTSLISCLTMM